MLDRQVVTPGAPTYLHAHELGHVGQASHRDCYHYGMLWYATAYCSIL